MRAILPLRKQDPEVSIETIGIQETAGAEDDTFVIPPKGVSIERLRPWKQSVLLVRDAARKYRYPLDLKQEEEKKRSRRIDNITDLLRFVDLKEEEIKNRYRRKVRAHAQDATYDPKKELQLLLDKAGIRRNPETELPVVLPRDYGIGEEQLMAMTRDHNYSALQIFGGVKGVANLLKASVDGGITGDDADLISRHIAFGSNTYHKKGKGFWSFLWEASQYLPLIILIGAAALSLGLGINTEGIKEGWYDGASIAFAVCLVIVVTAISDYKQSLQFRHLAIDESSIDESSIEVIRNGKIISISIFDLVVGDVVPLKIDHKVPADGLLISDQSLAIDESSIKGGSKNDQCYPGEKDAVLLCTNAGIKVRMVTGDNLQTAKDIALECGILSENDKIDEVIVEGEVFRALDEYQKIRMVDKIKVMAKSAPIDKLQLVKALKERGHVVAVTGDGTNDVAALYEADIGLAMGIRGTEVAEVSSDIIILDHNFSSVVKLVRWGRSVYANIQKFIQFQQTVNVAALIIILVAAVSSGNVPLNPVQLLWVNLIMDTLGALALASEPPSDSLMKRPPVSLREPLITKIMWRNSLIQAFFQVAVLLTLNIKGRSLLQLNNHSAVKANKIKNTFIFNTFVLFQVFNEFNARKPEEFNIFEGVTKNHLFVGIIGVTIVLQAMIIEFLGKFTSTVKLSWQLWLVSIGIAFVSWPLAFLGKFIPVPQTPLKDLIRKCCPQRKKATGQRDETTNPSLV